MGRWLHELFQGDTACELWAQAPLSDISAKKPLPATDMAFSRFAEQGLSSRQTGSNPVPQLSSAVYFRQAS